jgi:hypothetical protein
LEVYKQVGRFSVTDNRRTWLMEKKDIQDFLDAIELPPYVLRTSGGRPEVGRT